MQALDDNIASKTFAENLLENLEKDKKFLTKITFNDTAAFHISRWGNKENVSIWKSEIPHHRLEQPQL
jgi:hypothetical protein